MVNLDVIPIGLYQMLQNTIVPDGLQVHVRNHLARFCTQSQPVFDLTRQGDLNGVSQTSRIVVENFFNSFGNVIMVNSRIFVGCSILF